MASISDRANLLNHVYRSLLSILGSDLSKKRFSTAVSGRQEQLHYQKSGQSCIATGEIGQCISTGQCENTVKTACLCELQAINTHLLIIQIPFIYKLLCASSEWEKSVPYDPLRFALSCVIKSAFVINSFCIAHWVGMANNV